jgi:hypothetical protein
VTERLLPERKAVKEALRSLGMSANQVDKFIRLGWRGLVNAAEAEAAELRDALAALQKQLVEKQ